MRAELSRALCPSMVCAVLLLSCDAGPTAPGSDNVADATDSDTGRWYSAEQQTLGAPLFQQHCASCHGDQAQGLQDDWQQRLDDGSFPPPPLNGSAHTWHHPLPVLLQVISAGGVPLGGTMPAFADVLTEQEKLSVIAHFQSLWSDEIYAQWQQMGGTN